MIDYKNEIAKIIAAAAEMDADEVCSMIEVPADEKMGDFAFPCFKLAKVFRKAPPLIAAEIAEKIDGNGMFEKVEPVNAYLNMFVSREEMTRDVVTDALERGSMFAHSDMGNGKTAIVSIPRRI